MIVGIILILAASNLLFENTTVLKISLFQLEDDVSNVAYLSYCLVYRGIGNSAHLETVNLGAAYLLILVEDYVHNITLNSLNSFYVYRSCL